MQKRKRILALCAVGVGILLLGATLVQSIIGEYKFSASGNWLPFLRGLAGVGLMALGGSAYLYFGNPRDGVRRSAQARAIVLQSFWVCVVGFLLVVDYGCIGLSFCAAVMIFAVAGQGGTAMLIWLALVPSAYVLHRAAEYVGGWADAKREAQFS